jgi:hypothetical protein
VRLIEKSILGCERGTLATGCVLHLMQRGLKPDDVCVPFRAIANPDAHQAVQMTRAHATTSGQVRDTQTPVLTTKGVSRGGLLAKCRQVSGRRDASGGGSTRPRRITQSLSKELVTPTMTVVGLARRFTACP